MSNLSKDKKLFKYFNKLRRRTNESVSFYRARKLFLQQLECKDETGQFFSSLSHV